ncbi:hypothetical protein CALVIDRAFT_477485, partial [Calocera viscosa TUFC12733]
MADLSLFAAELRRACDTLENLVKTTASAEPEAADNVPSAEDPDATASHIIEADSIPPHDNAPVEDGPKWLNPEPDKSDNAEIWRTYVEEADKHDAALMKRWNEGIDVFLLFTGLFSAILSAFLVLAWPALQPDSSQATSDALAAISQQLLLLSSGLSMNASAAYQTPSFTPPRWALAVNCLWFTSLFVSLLTAVLAMLVKEWLSAYNDGVALVPLERAKQRQMRYDGLIKWNVPSIVSLLPLAIHLAVFLFLLGLVVFAWPVNNGLFALMTLLLFTGLGLYTSSAWLPTVYPSCPYRSP